MPGEQGPATTARHPADGDPVGSRPRPVVALLTAHWGSKTEEGWSTRQVAGAMANLAEVHVIALGGVDATTTRESVFTVHHLGARIARSAEVRRDLLIEALSQSDGLTPDLLTTSMTALLDRGLLEPWTGATQALKALQPDLVVIAGHQEVGALSAVDQCDAEVPVCLLALGSSTESLAFPRFKALVDRASSILVVTESERRTLVARYGDAIPVHRIGAPLGINLSALREPHPWVSRGDCILVLARVRSTDQQAENLACHLIRSRFPDHTVGLVYTDAFIVWRQGRPKTGWAIERSSDLARLLAFAKVTVDLRPGELLARTCVESLLYGTPIVVPSDSRAREHAELGRGGLWYDDQAELTWCIEAMFQPSVRSALSAQGQSYATERYGSTDGFIDRVRSGSGLGLPAMPPRYG